MISHNASPEKYSEAPTDGKSSDNVASKMAISDKKIIQRPNVAFVH